jgi:hypothetical protein
LPADSRATFTTAVFFSSCAGRYWSTILSPPVKQSARLESHERFASADEVYDIAELAGYPALGAGFD